MAPVSRCGCPCLFVATRAASGIVLNRDQEWGELLLYGSSLLYLLRARVLLGPTESVR